MNVPKMITLQVTSEEEADLSGLIVEMVVSTGQKNPYRIYFPQTDQRGTATLTRDDFAGQFKDHWESALMDHAGTLKNANPDVAVSLYDPSWSIANRDLALAWPLLTHERTKWASREEEYQSRISSRNTDFVATPVTVNLHQTNKIVLPVTKRVTGN